MNQQSQHLQKLMQQANIPSFKQLIHLAQVSEWQIRQLRRGNIAKMRVENLEKLAKALHIPLTQLIAEFSPSPTDRPTNIDLQQECDRLHQQLDRQQETLKQDFQHESLQIIESWLLQWPTVAIAVQKNPQLPAIRLLPLIKPIEALIEAWGLTAIAAVGEEIAYDPQWHQLMEGNAEIGEIVKVRYLGYCDRDRNLLYRAKVSKIAPPSSL
ncbi:helix-turn-helix transcriptional regulator [Spirulina sp. 06S082]|uniref:helix-turn-helix transcriptional regulator n=1 Tax=Spirulina sp. 06S082 TaxID=3110248 RepID=UPI002B21E9A3|nr:helix-turn-helix transcriptional regulator [Spirulina sp. 06S082]MEA5468365.1 helix-turn-helix transcriptional regulator [Spirulina sp. 06S082]